MKALAIIISIGVFAVGLFFGIEGKQDFEKYENTRVLLNNLSSKYGECRWVAKYPNASKLECPTELMGELHLAYDRYDAKYAKEKMVAGFAASLGGPFAILLFYLLWVNVLLPGVKKGAEVGVVTAAVLGHLSVEAAKSAVNATAKIADNAAGRTKECPHCAEMVKPHAKVCRHCGKDIT